jgi:hypothetical protein
MMKIRFARQPFSLDGGVEFVIMEVRTDRKRYTVKSLELEEVPSGGYIPPLGHLDQQSAQELMDNLWDCGLRPSEGTGSAGALAATQKHLEDMTQIAKGALRKIGITL